jgi:hypothetical protein
LTVPEVRRLLRIAIAPVEQQGFHLRWSTWRRAHQAVARRGHVAARARARPALPASEPTAATPHPDARPLPPGLTDAQWARVQPLLPPSAPVGRPPREARAVLAGVLWVLRTHASWRELPAHFGPWQTTYRRYRDWCASGTWTRLLQALNGSDALEQEVSL